MGLKTILNYCEKPIGDVPKNLFKKALDISNEGGVACLIPIRDTWYLCKEPTLAEVKTYRAGTVYNPAYAIEWLIGRCLVEPKQLPRYAMGAYSLIYEVITEILATTGEELQQISEYSDTLEPNIFERLAEYSEAYDLGDQMNKPCSTILVNFSKVKRIVETRHGFLHEGRLPSTVKIQSKAQDADDDYIENTEFEGTKQMSPEHNKVKMDDPVYGEREVDIGETLNNSLKNPKLPNIEKEIDLSLLLGGGVSRGQS